ncbi:MAG: hypothetical protein ACREJ3_17010 [Polyangiaceae bacterium]
MSRHLRQMMLAEVGEEGQARLAAARVRVGGGGLSADVAARYLTGSGVECVQVENGGRDPVTLTVDANGSDDEERGGGLGLRDPVAQGLGHGARAALRAIRAIVGASRPASERRP